MTNYLHSKRQERRRQEEYLEAKAMDDIRRGSFGLRDCLKAHDSCMVLRRVMFPRADEAIKGP